MKKSLRRATRQQARISYHQLKDPKYPHEKLEFEEMLMSDSFESKSETQRNGRLTGGTDGICSPQQEVESKRSKKISVQDSIILLPDEIRILEVQSPLNSNALKKTSPAENYESLKGKSLKSDDTRIAPNNSAVQVHYVTNAKEALAQESNENDAEAVGTSQKIKSVVLPVPEDIKKGIISGIRFKYM